MRRLRLTLEYDGSDFQGWQLQASGRSVQGVVEAAFKEITQEELRVHGAGRTDAGVHAAGMVAHVDTKSGLGALELRKALNAVLPGDVAVNEVHDAAPDFDARRHALSKTYVYRILNRAARSPLRRNRVWHLRGALDLEAMRRAAEPLLGSHDFAAFRGAAARAPADEVSRRHVERLDVSRRGDEVVLEAQGRSFLRYMVRNLTGTLVECAQGRRDPSEMPEILASGDRSRAGVTAPPEGLCLLRIDYPDFGAEDRRPGGKRGPVDRTS